MSKRNMILETVASTLRDDPDISEPKREQLVKNFGKRYQPPLESDRWIYRIVVASLGLAILMTIVFSFVIYFESEGGNPKIPDLFLAIGSAAVGALAGLLSPRQPD